MSDQTQHHLHHEFCPCGSMRTYELCCEPYLSHRAIPATAEQLMRSRYTAYVKLAKDYLLQTWHPDTRPVELELTPDPPLKWRELNIISTTQGAKTDIYGTVEFIARYKLNGKAAKLHEISAFMREQGRWLYLNAQNT